MRATTENLVCYTQRDLRRTTLSPPSGGCVYASRNIERHTTTGSRLFHAGNEDSLKKVSVRALAGKQCVVVTG